MIYLIPDDHGHYADHGPIDVKFIFQRDSKNESRGGSLSEMCNTLL